MLYRMEMVPEPTEAKNEALAILFWQIPFYMFRKFLFDCLPPSIFYVILTYLNHYSRSFSFPATFVLKVFIFIIVRVRVGVGDGTVSALFIE